MNFTATSALRIAIVAFSCLAAALTCAADVSLVLVRPSTTDPAIKTFDTPHRIYLRPSATTGPDVPAPLRNQLLLWIPGTVSPTATRNVKAKTATSTPAEPPPDAEAASLGAGREGAEAFCQLAARLGYHVISLRYPNDRSASVARFDDNPAEFEHFRLALITGGTSKHLTIPRTESIEHRLIKLLQHLASARPTESWNQFLTTAGAIRWEALAVAGQSQGGGHAALIGLHHRVARVIATGAPKDYNLTFNAPAAWLTRESATPKSRFFTFNHLQDRQAATWPQQLANLRALKLDAFGSVVIVESAEPPYRHARILATNYPGGTLTSQEAHTTVISFRHAAVFDPVWRYMLTAPVE
jgi:hypothetical protein